MNNDYLVSVFLGVVEGLTEFLPISSTAHLRLAQYLLGISLENEFWKLFAIFIQLGAILAVAIIYRERLWSFIKDISKFYNKSPAEIIRHPASLIGIAFVVTAIPALLLKKLIGQNLESLWVMAAALFIGGIVMLVVDKFWNKGQQNTLESIKPWQAVVIGAAQILSALFPGTSRSMSTMAGAQLTGMSRSLGLEFSFLLSIPVMVAATCYDMFKFYRESPPGALGFNQLALLFIGFSVSFIVAYGVVYWFLGYVRHRGFGPFAIYRLIVGVIVFFMSLKQ